MSVAQAVAPTVERLADALVGDMAVRIDRSDIAARSSRAAPAPGRAAAGRRLASAAGHVEAEDAGRVEAEDLGPAVVGEVAHRALDRVGGVRPRALVVRVV